MNSERHKYENTRTYRIAQGWRAFILIFTVITTGFFIYICSMLFTDSQGDFSLDIILVLVFIGINLLCILGTIYMYRYRLLIYEDRMVLRTLFKEREVYFNEVTGFRIISDHAIRIETNTKKNKITVSMHIERKNEFIDWIFDKFKSFDEEDIEKEIDEILDDAADNCEKEIIIHKYEQAGKIINLLNILGLIGGLWLFIYPEPYKLAVIANISITLLAFIVMIVFRNIVDFDERKNSARHSIGIAIMLPASALAYRAFGDFNLIYSKVFWIYLGIFSLLLYIFILIVTREYKRNKVIVALLIIFTTFYCYGVIINVNCIFDYSTPAQYNARIIDKSIEEGKSKSYYITVAQWGSFGESDIIVSKDYYENVNKDEIVPIYLKSGLLGIGWFYPDKF